MELSSFCRLTLATCLAALTASVWNRSAGAAVVEPDGRAVPIAYTESTDYPAPDGKATTGTGVTAREIALPALFEFFGETLGDSPLDYLNAASEPQYFSPLCGFKGTLVLHGGGCRVDFGWYNVDDPNHTIYPLITQADYATLPNSIFYPRIPTTATAGGCTDPPICTGWTGWTPIQGKALTAISSDPNYLGGYVGLAVAANPSSVCTQSKYSEPRLNPATNWGGNWISMVMWKSTRIRDAYYVGVEDLPMAADNFQGFPGQTYMNDGDFNDFVYLIEGVQCAGGGQPCSVAGEGACGLGLTECNAEGTIQCVKQMSETPEVCDNIDNDCNGQVDDNAPCPAGKACWRGTCVTSCSSSEFPCTGGLQCDESSGVCVDPECLKMDVPCPSTQVCFGGQCFGGCEGVVCPEGQVCQLGRCYDACANHAPCAAGQVCEGGVCVQKCQCRVCPQGRTCAADGRCVPEGCTDPSTKQALGCGTDTDSKIKYVCSGGQCVSICQGVVCPGGAQCDPVAGECGAPVGQWKPIEDAGIIVTGSGGSSGTPAANGVPNQVAPSSGCGCRTSREASSGIGGLALLGLTIALFGRRRAA